MDWDRFPGHADEVFEIYLDTAWLKPGDRLTSMSCEIRRRDSWWRRLLVFLGCYYVYEIELLASGRPHGGGYDYPAALTPIKLYIFGIQVWKYVKHENIT